MNQHHRQRKNLVISTTRQWNVGDEFICRGVEVLLKQAGFEFNPILFNRNPLVFPRPWTDRMGIVESSRRPDENSLMRPLTGILDGIVFAGTPEWRGGRRVGPLLKIAVEDQLRCVFLGVGSSGRFSLRGEIVDVMRDLADLVVCRDEPTFRSMEQYENTHLLPCPSIFACGVEVKTPEINSIETIGLVLQGDETPWQSVPAALAKKMVELGRRLATSYRIKVICHYIREMPMAEALAGEIGADLYYSGESRDYPGFIENCDLVISTRVHACGLASSLEIPSIYVPHDGRVDTVRHLGAKVVSDVDEIPGNIQKVDWTAHQASLRGIRTSALGAYVKLLTEVNQKWTRMAVQK